MNNHAEIGAPFLSEEWKWYLENSRHSNTDGNDLKEAVIEQVSRISDLVRKVFSKLTTTFHSDET